jgi:hypothetical protein
VTDKRSLTACVEFAAGTVMFIGYKLGRIDLRSSGLGICAGYIVAMLRRDRFEVESFVRWKQSIRGYYRIEGLAEGTRFHVALTDGKSLEPRLRCVIEELTVEGYLDRGQELRAYAGLGIAYGQRKEEATG